MRHIQKLFRRISISSQILIILGVFCCVFWHFYISFEVYHDIKRQINTFSQILNVQLRQFIADNSDHMSIYDFERIRANARGLNLPYPTIEFIILGQYGEPIYAKKNPTEDVALPLIRFKLDNGTLTISKKIDAFFDFKIFFNKTSSKDAAVSGILNLNKLVSTAFHNIKERYFLGMLFFTILMLIIYFSVKKITLPLFEFSRSLRTRNQEYALQDNTISCLEFEKIITSFNEHLKIQKKLQTDLVRQESEINISKTASQVAHDIRSPLAALDVACSVTHELPEEKRLLIRQAVSRIRDIANNLVHKSRSAGAKDSAAGHAKKETEEFAICLLPSLVDELITEKRLQHRANMNIEILADLDKKSYGLFAKIQPVEFKRVLSNLVNNAVEAFDLGQEDKGQVIMSVGANGHSPDMITIKISDNGKGIPAEILPKLMERGMSFGKEKEKESGSGLGLYHAKTTLQSWGGDLRIESIPVGADRCVGPNTGQTHRSAPTTSGTTITISLPKEPAPKWFVPQLTLLPHVHLAVLDDDVSIHQIWDGRLAEMGFEKERIHHFSTTSALRKWFQQSNGKKNVIYLFDYELIGQRQTGLDLIQELGIAKKSILVTSRYEEPHVLKQCQQQGVKMIPKPMAGFVPIEINRANTEIRPYRTPDVRDDNQKSRPDGILIDDDESLRISWKLMAKALNKILKVYESVEAFFKEAAQFDKTTPIYIDSDLGPGIKGEEVSKQLSEMGFTNIYLATGYNPKDFGDMPWIKGIVGKTPPWQ